MQRMGLTHTSALNCREKLAGGSGSLGFAMVWATRHILLYQPGSGSASTTVVPLHVSWGKLAPTHLRHLTPVTDVICKYQLL